MQRALDDAGSEAIRTLQAEAPALFDSVLDRIVDQAGLTNAEVSLEDVRHHWDEATEHLILAKSDVARWSLLGTLANWLAKACLRRRTVIISEVMDALTRQGGTHISAAVAKEYLRDRMIQCLADLVRSRMMVMRCGSLLIASTMMALPVGVCRVRISFWNNRGSAMERFPNCSWCCLES